MHLPSHELPLRPNPATVLQHSTDTSASAPAKTHSSLNIRDKRNIKIGIVALRTVSKWCDKAALTLEKLEGQDMSKHCQERQARLTAENGGTASGKGMQETGVWRETVVYPVPVRTSVSRAIGLHDEPKVYQEPSVFGKDGIHGTVEATEIPSSEAHHAHVLTTVVEYYNETSDDEDEGKVCREIDTVNDTDIDTDTNECSSDVSSNEEEEEADSNNDNKSPQDNDNKTDNEKEDSSDDADDSEKEVQPKHPANSHVKK